MNNIWLDSENIRQFGKTNKHEESMKLFSRSLQCPFVMLISGQRCSGKTWFVQHLQKSYFNKEDGLCAFNNITWKDVKTFSILKEFDFEKRANLGQKTLSIFDDHGFDIDSVQTDPDIVRIWHNLIINHRHLNLSIVRIAQDPMQFSPLLTKHATHELQALGKSYEFSWLGNA